ncbi:hypothetical protein ACFQ0B_10215 [Nonomuraea thailandensis]
MPMVLSNWPATWSPRPYGAHPDGRIHIEIETTAEGLRLLVRDPRTPDPVGSREWSEISSFTLSFGTQSGPEGHEAWALLRSPDAVPA